MNELIITGSSGFVGSNLVNYLSKNDIHNFVELSLRNHIIEQTNAKTIIHLAGKAHDLKNISNPDEYYRVNFELTKKLYDAFLKSDASKFIFISTVKAVADHLNEPLTEDVVPNPQTHYGKSKLMAEQYIISRPLPQGKSYYILRPCMIHGPGNKGNLNLLYNFVSKGLPYPLAAFENKRSFLSVENLCFVIKNLIERTDITGGVYNVADDEALSTSDLVSLISQSINRAPRLINISKKIINFLAVTGDKLELPLNTERLGKLTESYIVSNNKLKNALNSEFPLTAKEGIIKTTKSFKDTKI